MTPLRPHLRPAKQPLQIGKVIILTAYAKPHLGKEINNALLNSENAKETNLINITKI